MAEMAFICPFCGAPYQTLIPAGTVQVKCDHCGALILVPPHLGGSVRRCPNHLDSLATGICNDCGESYCDYCLNIFDIKGGKLYVCSRCYQNRRSRNLVGWIIIVVIAMIGMAVPLGALTGTGNTNVPKGVFVGLALFEAFFLLAVLVAIFRYIKKQPLSVYDSREKTRNR